ncbi:hydroxymethylglutaryl-CoA synthase [Candidatus Gottesmanbacteria bacterium]|nr:hydroxymethylglutaryl-CoA synthase [Candidatus Gottesmanbacteria bacterium]
MIGIRAYGAYVPQYRVSISDIAEAWKKNGDEIQMSLGILQKSVPGIDEDAVTLAIEAAGSALSISNIDPQAIEALFVGSESHPYAVNPTSTIVGEFLGIGHNYLASDLEFACKAGTAGVQAILGLVASGQIISGLAIGTDTAQSKPHDALEYTSASAAAAFLLGKDDPKSTPLLASVTSYTSYSSDTPDFWRRDGMRFPSHAGRFTGEPAYFAHVMGAALHLFEKAQCKSSDFDYCVFHMPNAKFPRDVARRLGFTKEQLAPSLVIDDIGNPYSASSLLGLVAVLDEAKPNEKIFMVSYGSGAGSDAFIFETTEEILKFQEKRKHHSVLYKVMLQNTANISYTEYLKHTHKI